MRKWLAMLAAAAMFCGVVTAAQGFYTVEAQLSPDVTVKIDGVERTFFNTQGQEMHPISYAGTTYVPIRSIGELMDKNVNWDASTNTATIGGERVTPDATGVKDKNAQAQTIALRMEPNFTIVIDGVERTFLDPNGKVCDPALYDGSIYLPIRAIGEIMGKTVAWDADSKTVLLSGETTEGVVTDADTTNSSKPSDSDHGTSSAAVTLEEAKQIALQHAGKTAAQVTLIKAENDYDDGQKVYEVEFYSSSSDGTTKYEYKVQVTTGAIVDYGWSLKNYVSQGSGSISEARAKEIALAKVPGATVANLYEFERDYDDGRYQYEGKIVYEGKGYEFSIDASSGVLTDWEVQTLHRV
ncbi:MAG: PepSY domain-containing protein [Eubacteriales bacterium]|jgi:uncharacterized membrane protein YkoI